MASAAPATRCIIGIDLGTSRSGYSYAFGSSPSGIKFPQQYTRDDLVGQGKTDTAMLFEAHDSGNWRLDCWGTSAVNKYTQELATSTRYHLILGKHFKMALASQDPSHLPPEWRLPHNCPYSAEQLITLMLQCLKDHARQHLLETVGFDSEAAEMLYCLSVPAGWSLKAKKAMHSAAEQAGMTIKPPANTNTNNLPPLRCDSTISTGSISSISSSFGGGARSLRDQRLSRDQARSGSRGAGTLSDVPASAVVLIHEQEAAALTACIDPMKDAPTLRAIPGQVWMIVDAGGGTVDLALHQIEASSSHPRESQLSERLRSRCLLLGSTMLDAQAEANLLAPLFGSAAAYEAWKTEDPQSYISQMCDWEGIKTKWDGSNTEYLKLDYGLLERLPSNPPGVQRGRLPVSADALRQHVFEPVLQPILDNVVSMLATKRKDGGTGADVMVLAGGFGSSPYLQRRLAEATKGLLQEVPVRPGNTGRAVMLGNTIHLQRPDAILARVSRLTYGLNVGDHPTDSCRTHGRCITDRKGRMWCETHFRPLVRMHDIVQMGDSTPPLVVYPMLDTDVVQVPIYATTSADTDHVTEKGMQQVGLVKVNVEKAAKVNLGIFKAGKQSNDAYRIELSFKFGAAEMQAQAYDVTNKRYVNTEFSFSSEAAGAEHNQKVQLPGVRRLETGLAAMQL